MSDELLDALREAQEHIEWMGCPQGYSWSDFAPLNQKITAAIAKAESEPKKMSNELQRQESVEVRFQDLSPEYAEIMVLGKVLQLSGYFKDVRDQAQAVTKILFGRELGISPINSMSAIHIIEGKPALSSNLLAALIKRSGKYDYRVKSWSDQECVLTFRQLNVTEYPSIGKWEDVGESSFTIEDAKRAGVVKPGGSWSKYPKAMLFARALSQGERTYCPDVSVCALYVPEELGATVNEAGEVEELPASRGVKEVTRTTAPIPIARPTGLTTATKENFDEGLGNLAMQAAAQHSIKGNAPKVAEPERETTPPVQDPIPALADALVERINPDPEETISLAEQRRIHRAFREAIPATAAESTKKSADTILREYLKHRTFTDAEGNGSTRGIPVLLFPEILRDVQQFASTLR